MLRAKGFNDCFKLIPLSKFLCTILLFKEQWRGHSRFLFPLGCLIGVSPLASHAHANSYRKCSNTLLLCQKVFATQPTTIVDMKLQIKRE